jgi:DNA protecting protein DprA
MKPGAGPPIGRSAAQGTDLPPAVVSSACPACRRRSTLLRAAAESAPGPLLTPPRMLALAELPAHELERIVRIVGDPWVAADGQERSPGHQAGAMIGVPGTAGESQRPRAAQPTVPRPLTWRGDDRPAPFAAGQAHTVRQPRAVLCPHSIRYPPLLTRLPAHPSALYLAGRERSLVGRPAVAIVGARRASQYARGVAFELGRSLAVAGITVVSTLDVGVAACALGGALSARRPAVAVTAGGAATPVATALGWLHVRLLEWGTAVSELAWEASQSCWGARAAPRIVAGLAEVLIVVEAAERSLSLFMADLAGDLGREVGAVPGRVGEPGAEGSNALLRDGAHVIVGVRDVLDLMAGVSRAAQPRGRPPPRAVRLG